jgi:uncharacterized membrane protein
MAKTWDEKPPLHRLLVILWIGVAVVLLVGGITSLYLAIWLASFKFMWTGILTVVICVVEVCLGGFILDESDVI